MSFFRYLLSFGSLFFILISFTNAITLDIPCTNATQCGGQGTKCQDATCKCDTPYYLPCLTTTCSVNPAFVYEGQTCRIVENCLNNTICEKEQCKCKPDFTASNGLCYKSLNTTCSSSSECWSNDCREGVCKCPLGSEPRGDNLRCKRKLAKLSANWTIANASGEFCNSEQGIAGCQDIHAVCKSILPNRESFCQCELPFEANYDKQECELKQYPGALSPSETELPAVQCGRCQDPNALCVTVNQTTCWCRSGFSKAGDNKCDKSRHDVLFPNSYDISTHDYASPGCAIVGDNGTTVSPNGLCVCAPGYQYVDKNTPCQRIEPEWKGDNFEYGVCTRIDSQGSRQDESGLCPSPLTCQLRRDKSICSCGLNQFLADDNTKCYLFLERTLSNPVSSDCPPHANVNKSQCVCSPYGLYKTSGDKRRCELKLSSAESGSSQAGELDYNTTCVTLYGEYSRFYSQGECQCIPNKSFYTNENGKERCATLLDVNTANTNDCPFNAESNGGLCKCKTGYRPIVSSNRLCERKVNQLYDLSNAPSQGAISDVTTIDCQALYTNTPVRAHNNACVCNDGTFFQNSTCNFFLEYALPSPTDSQYCPPNSDGSTQVCKCVDGYKNDGTNRTCTPRTSAVYENNTPGAENTTGINDVGCRRLFGNAAKASQNDGHCECLEAAFAFWSSNRCFFRVEVIQAALTSDSTCPVSSMADSYTCKCPLGYNVTVDKQGCSRKNIFSEKLQAIDPTMYTACDAPNNDNDCEALHGSGAVCRNNTCYCDRRRSFVRSKQCELFSKYVFPGTHERSSVTCNSQEDCGIDADQKNIECGTTSDDSRYKVCKCKSGYFLNPADLTCVNNRCPSQCQDNAECYGYTCVCKKGYYTTPSGQCVKQEPPLKLHEKCNTTVWSSFTNDGELFCSSSCQRAQCFPYYRDDGSRCIKNNFDDSCAHAQNFCSAISPYAGCNRDENKCACSPGFYRSDSNSICARAVNGYCTTHEICGDFGECLSNQCRCKAGRREQQVTDSFGRSITRCINGVGQLRFSPVIFLFFILVRIILA
ncbi:hypothetical protein I4U23_001611 [Adineta vaga]|nr:hypothetical protein I4U23_001611 [Adineta vaga]